MLLALNESASNGLGLTLERGRSCEEKRDVHYHARDAIAGLCSLPNR